jgi:hypothetical protein
MRRLSPTCIAAWHNSTLTLAHVANRLDVSAVTPYNWLRGRPVRDRYVETLTALFVETLTLAPDVVFLPFEAPAPRPKPLRSKPPAGARPQGAGPLTITVPAALELPLRDVATRRGISVEDAAILGLRGICAVTLRTAPRCAPETK